MEQEDKNRELEEEPADLELADRDADQVVGGADATPVSNIQKQRSDANKGAINNMR